MNPGAPIACRTRYKRRKLFQDALIMSRRKKKAREDARVKIKPVSVPSSSSSAAVSTNSERVSESDSQRLGEHENDPIEISDGDDGSEADERLRDSESNIFCDEVEKKSDEDEGCIAWDDKVVNFGDDNCGVSDNPVVSPVDNDDEDDHESSTDNEDHETSDEDFQVVGHDGFKTEGSIWDESDDDDDRGGDDVKRGYRKIVKDRVKKMESDAESSEILKRKDNEHVDEEEPWIMADCTSAISSKSEIYKKEGQHAEHKHEAKRMQSVIADSELFGVHGENSGCFISSEAGEHMKKNDKDDQSVTLQKQTGDSTVVENSARNKNIDFDSVDIDDIKRKKNQQNKGTGLRSVSFRPKNQEKIGDSAKIVKEKDKEGEPKYWFNSKNQKKVGAVDDETGDEELYEVPRMPSTLKNKCYKFFTECFKDDSDKLDEKDDVVVEGQTQAEKPVEKSEEEELDMLWAEMDMLLRAEEIGTQVNLFSFPS